MASQFLRPDSNVTQTNFTGGFAQIDESSASDSDYALSTVNTISTLEVGLSNPGTAVDTTRPTTVRYRACPFNSLGDPAGGVDLTLTCYVYEGATLRAAGETHLLDPVGAFVTYELEPDLSAVSDFNDVRLRFVTSAQAGRCVAISWAELETNPNITFDDELEEAAIGADSIGQSVDFNPTLTESATPGDVYITASNANIHAFTRLPFGEIWFLVPTGTENSHTYFTFCVDESQRANAPVWFKGGIDAAAVLDDPQLGADGPWSCLRIPDETGASLISFDRRADGTDDIEWHITSSAFYIDEANRRVHIKRFYKDFENQGEPVELQILTYDFPAGNNIAAPTLTLATTDTTKDFRVSGRMMKMKYSGTGHWRAGKPAFDFESMGER